MCSSTEGSAPPRVIVSSPGATDDSSRRAIAHGSSQPREAPPVQPLRLPPQAVATLWVRGPARAKGRRASSSLGYRVLGISFFAIVVASLAACITTMVL